MAPRAGLTASSWRIAAYRRTSSSRRPRLPGGLVRESSRASAAHAASLSSGRIEAIVCLSRDMPRDRITRSGGLQGRAGGACGLPGGRGFDDSCERLMSELKIIVEAEPPRAWIEVIERGLRTHNTAATGIVEIYPVGFLVKDAGGAILGGLFGGIWGGWLHVGSLWVDLRSRGRGYATQLMAAAEKYAIGKGCVAAFLQTASYEARPLYEKLGYRVFGELDEHPVDGHRRYYLTKRPLTGIEAKRRDPHDGANLVMQPYASAEVERIIHDGV